MIFSSYIFIFLFMPVTLLLYFLAGKLNNMVLNKVVLLIASFIFLFYGLNYIGVIAVLISIAINYSIYKLISCEAKFGKYKKLFLSLGIIVNTSSLLLFKYFNTFVYYIDKFRNVGFVERNIILPLGISFYTFQQIAFLVDAYRGEVEKCNLLDYCVYVCYFPRIISGPILSSDQFLPQLKDAQKLKFQYENFNKGLYRFSVGLAKKVLIADVLAGPVNAVFSYPEGYYALNMLIGVLAYTFEIYFDFSGYCDMAIGVSKMLNFDMPENFNSPYKATNIKDFWGRWHMTLTDFLTKYVYIPLGGSRKGTVRTYINILIIFIISGLWHGSGKMKLFLIWGISHGIAMIVYRIFKKSIDKWHPSFGWFVTFSFVSLAWIPFGVDSIEKVKVIFSNLFNLNALSTVSRVLVESFKTPEIIFVEQQFPKFTFFVTQPFLYPVIFLAIFFLLVLNRKNAKEVTDDFKATIGISLKTAILLVWSIISISGIGTFIYAGF